VHFATAAPARRFKAYLDAESGPLEVGQLDGGRNSRRAALHPRRLAGSITAAENQKTWRECATSASSRSTRFAGKGKTTAPFPQPQRPYPQILAVLDRWEAAGVVRKTKQPLERAVKSAVARPAWSPARQKASSAMSNGQKNSPRRTASAAASRPLGHQARRSSERTASPRHERALENQARIVPKI